MHGPVITYIDGANLHKGLDYLGWKLDYRRFRSWIRQKFGVTTARLFIGLMQRHAGLYTFLQDAGYQLVFKEIIFDGNGKAKGNCDADLVLSAVRDFFELNPSGVILVSSDGDYAPLIKFWQEKGVDCTVLSPAMKDRCSILLKRTGVSIVCLGDVRHKLEYVRK